MSTQKLTYVAKIKNLDEVKKALDWMGIACSKLWNVALYHSRKVWEGTGKIPNAYETQKAIQSHYWYKHLPYHTSQAVLQELWGPSNPGSARAGKAKMRPAQVSQAKREGA